MQEDKPFVMRLRGPGDVITRDGETLVQQFKAEIVIRHRGRQATLVAKVPQENADAVMLALGLP